MVSVLWQTARVKILSLVRWSRVSRNIGNLLSIIELSRSKEIRLKYARKLFDYIYRNQDTFDEEKDNLISVLQNKLRDLIKEGARLHKFEALFNFPQRSCIAYKDDNFCNELTDVSSLCPKHQGQLEMLKQGISSFVELPGLSQLIIDYAQTIYPKI